MNSILNQIEQINFRDRLKEELSEDFEKAFSIIAPTLSETEKALLQDDFTFYIEDSGRFRLLNTFAGGIIFLREPETIVDIKIEFNSDNSNAVASVEYASEKRNSRNVKYKPNAGKVEMVPWNMLGIFPNYVQHKRGLKLILMAIIGRIVKRICEHNRTTSWFMKYEKEFDVKLFLDGKLELECRVETT